jgi:hypothetical protein
MKTCFRLRLLRPFRAIPARLLRLAGTFNRRTTAAGVEELRGMSLQDLSIHPADVTRPSSHALKPPTRSLLIIASTAAPGCNCKINLLL